MAVSEDNYRNNDTYHHLRNDIRDTHTNATVARILAILALILAAVALGWAIAAWNKANDAAGNAQRALSINQKQ